MLASLTLTQKVLAVFASLAIAGAVATTVTVGVRNGQFAFRATTPTGTTPPPTTGESATEEPTAPTPTDPYAGWKTYTNTKGGFSFRYPADWRLSQGSDRGVNVRTRGFNVDQTGEGGGTGTIQDPYGSFSVDVSVFNKFSFDCPTRVETIVVDGHNGRRCKYQTVGEFGSDYDIAQILFPGAGNSVWRITMTNSNEMKNADKQRYRAMLDLILNSVKFLAGKLVTTSYTFDSCSNIEVPADVEFGDTTWWNKFITQIPKEWFLPTVCLNKKLGKVAYLRRPDYADKREKYVVGIYDIATNSFRRTGQLDEPTTTGQADGAPMRCTIIHKAWKRTVATNGDVTDAIRFSCINSNNRGGSWVTYSFTVPSLAVELIERDGCLFEEPDCKFNEVVSS